MKKQTRSILQELSNIHIGSNGDEFIQSTGQNLIESAINLIGRIHDTYPPEVAGDLERRFLNSIRAGSPRKYSIGMQKVMESKK
jgi:hypothetical protein